jgi:L-cysteine S-thiosulfotransferase
MTPYAKILGAALGAVVVAGCATVAAESDYGKTALAMLKQDFRSKGPATVERVTTQDEAQQLCSQYPQERPAEVSARIEAAQQKTIRPPADGKYLGSWKEGEKVAQNGRGMQSSDTIGAVNGGNCYACHQITKQEISFGNIGPSLVQYGKLRGNSDEILKYTWGKIYNAQAYAACSNMPRFGHNGILTEAQIKDVMALLLDPASPVNQ